nr:glycosyltransferase family 2 protein [Eubacterium sp.]
MDSLYIVMPAYNEEDNITNVVEQWYKVLEGKSDESRLVIADYGSKDHTHEILLKLKETRFPQLELLESDNQFHGPKVIALYDYAIRKNADYIFQTDSDGQTNPEEFGAFWEERNKYEAIFGNRTSRGDGKDRAFVEKVVCFLLKMYFGVKVPDANAPFRLMKASSVKKYL